MKRISWPETNVDLNSSSHVGCGGLFFFDQLPAFQKRGFHLLLNAHLGRLIIRHQAPLLLLLSLSLRLFFVLPPSDSQ